MLPSKEHLVHLAVKLASDVPLRFRGRWCFFAGFAFVLNGVDKKTNDIDVLARDDEVFKQIAESMRKIGMQSKTMARDYACFTNSSDKQLTIDLILMSSKWMKHFSGIWQKLEYKEVKGVCLPLASPAHLILLKVFVNAHRDPNDRKRKQDLVDVRELMLRRKLTAKQVMDAAIHSGTRELTLEFFSKIS